MSPSLIIAPDVMRQLGGQVAADALFAKAEGTYCCTVCGRPGILGRQYPASVVLVVARNGATHPRNIKFAHPNCSDSMIRIVKVVGPTNQLTALPGAAWLRPADTDPPAVLVIAQAKSDLDPDGGSLRSGSCLSQLVERGFARLSDPDTNLPQVAGLTAWHTPGRLAIYDRAGEVVWDGRLPSSHAWTYAAVRCQWLGVVVATGVQFAEPGQARGLYTAITGGRAAGAAIRIADPTPVASRRWPNQIRSYAGNRTPVNTFGGPISNVVGAA